MHLSVTIILTQITKLDQQVRFHLGIRNNREIKISLSFGCDIRAAKICGKMTGEL